MRNLTPCLDEIRGVKSPAEIVLLREAGRLSAQAVIEAMRATRPGMYEYELNAIAHHVYLKHGARGEGYRAIIASGTDNTWHSHYFLNNCVMRYGDMVLMDTAPDYRYYTSDIGRMFPVNGTYTAWQRDLYGFVVDYHKILLSCIRPGVTADQIMAEAAERAMPLIGPARLSANLYRQAAKRLLEYKGNLSHSVGMSVHDVGGYKQAPLRPGVVFAVDPQMWIPEEKLYIRVEDTVVVTETGIEVLTGAAPLDLDEVEALMRQGGKA